MNYQKLKEKHQENYNKLFKSCGVFYALNDKQYNEQVKKIKGEILSLGFSAFLPADNLEKLKKGEEKIKEYYKKEIEKIESEEAIKNELLNYECFYTGEIDDVVNLFDGIFTKEAIKKVFLNNNS